MIETRHLYYFLAVAREQNITRAADTLHITQPTLSKQLMDLNINSANSCSSEEKERLHLQRKEHICAARHRK